MSRIYYPQARVILQVIFDGFGPTARDTDPVVIPIIPKAVTVHKNSYKQADSWSITFDANDLPIDPQLIRGGSAEVYLFESLGIDDDQRVVARNLTLQDAPAFKPRDPIDTVELEQGARKARDRFTMNNRPIVAGLFDDADMELSDSGKWVTIEGQDYTAHLAGKQWPPNPNGTARRIPTGKRLDLILEEILAEADPDGRLALVVRGADPSSLPIVGKNEVRSNRRGIPVESDTSFWDVMYKLATRYGMILFVDGLDVVLSRPQNLTADDTHRVRRMAWGRNLESMRLTRHLGKEQVPTIVVVGYDPTGRQRFTAEYPKDGLKRVAQQFKKGGKQSLVEKHKAASKTRHGRSSTPTVSKSEEFQYVPAFGITDRATAAQMAETLFNLLGRAERTVVMKTRDLKDLRDVGLLDLRSGDAVVIEWDEFNREIIADPRVPRGAKIQHLVDRGYGQAVSAVIADHYSKLEALRRPLRVREATFEYETDSGISIEAELIDFIVVDGLREAGMKEPRRSAG